MPFIRCHPSDEHWPAPGQPFTKRAWTRVKTIWVNRIHKCDWSKNCLHYVGLPYLRLCFAITGFITLLRLAKLFWTAGSFPSRFISWRLQFCPTATAKSFQSCPTLCNLIDGSLQGSPVPRILQARTLEWVAISLSNAWKWKVKVKSLSRVRLFATHRLQLTRLLCPWDSPGKSTRVGCHCLLQILP